MSVLSDDIIDLIVNNLFEQHGRLSVIPLLSVSTAFHHSARRHLFQRVGFMYGARKDDLDSLEQRCRKILSALDGDSSVVHLVRSVTITILEDRFNRGRARFDTTSTLINTEPPSTFLRVLHAFSNGSNAQRLEITTMNGNPVFGPQIAQLPILSPVPLAKLPLPLVTALLAYRCNPAFEQLVLRGMTNVPCILLTGIPSKDRIKSLALLNVDFSASHEDLLFPYSAETLPPFLTGIISIPGSHTPFRYLSSTKMEKVDPAKSGFFWTVCRPLGPSDFSERSLGALEAPDKNFTFPLVKTFKFPATDDSAGRSNTRLFINACPKLEEIELLFSYSKSPASSKFQDMEILAQQSELRNNLRILSLDDTCTSVDNPSFLTSFLQYSLPLPSLETLRIRKIPARSFFESKDDWKILEEIVSLLPSLRRLELSIERYDLMMREVRPLNVLMTEEQERLSALNGGRVTVLLEMNTGRWG